MKYLILILIFINISKSYAIEDKYYLVNGCTIFDLKGNQIRKFPGERCIFLENGDFVSGTEEKIKYFNEKLEIRWVIDGIFHHQLNLNGDGSKILALSSSIQLDENGIKKMFAKLMVISLEGDVLLSSETSPLLQQIHIQSQNNPSHLMNVEGALSLEGSHFNSFYEVPKLKRHSNIPNYIKPGNFILNSSGQGIFVLDSSLKNILFHSKVSSSPSHIIHDVQVTSSGTILFFNNQSKGSNDNLIFSTIDEIDPATGKLVFQIKANPKSIFFKFCGGVQALGNDMILYSHNYAGVFIYSKKMKQNVFANYDVFKVNGELMPSQQIKLQDLTSFLSHWK